MIISAQVLCELNKVIIESQIQKFTMYYEEEIGLDIFFSLLLGNLDKLGEMNRKKLKNLKGLGFNPLAQQYGRQFTLFIIDGKKFKTLTLNNNDDEFYKNFEVLKQTFEEGLFSLR
jgi:hypothetical protein